MWHPYLMFWGVKPPAAINEKRIGAKEYPLMHKRGLCHIPSTIRAMEDGKVRAMWAIADNLIVAEMDNRRNWDILKNKLDFFFVSDLFMTPTAELADIVLPAAFYPEIDQLVEAFGHPSSTVTATKKVVEPVGRVPGRPGGGDRDCQKDGDGCLSLGYAEGLLQLDAEIPGDHLRGAPPETQCHADLPAEL